MIKHEIYIIYRSRSTTTTTTTTTTLLPSFLPFPPGKGNVPESDGLSAFTVSVFTRLAPNMVRGYEASTVHIHIFIATSYTNVSPPTTARGRPCGSKSKRDKDNNVVVVVVGGMTVEW